MFLRRLGNDPIQCSGSSGCPDIWELENGDFAIIGADITNMARELPPSAGCGSNERIIKIPRNLLIQAKRDIPDAS
jgi:hypothetical protein